MLVNTFSQQKHERKIKLKNFFCTRRWTEMFNNENEGEKIN